MKIIGLTGGIAMGKSEAAKILRRLKVPVFSADEMVAKLWREDKKLMKQAKKLFPEAFPKGRLDKRIMAALIFSDAKKRKKLEGLLHPKVRAGRKAFLQKSAQQGHMLAVLDIPLLFETEQHKQVDLIVVVSAPAAIRRTRALKRKNMTKEKLANIIKQQWPDARKKKRADWVIDTGKSRRHHANQWRKLLKELGIKK
ncbi:MAG: dephospho-CoA kinase [Dongiaceae bacterium]